MLQKSPEIKQTCAAAMSERHLLPTLRRDIRRFTYLMKGGGFFARARLIFYTPGLWIAIAYRVCNRLSIRAENSLFLKPFSACFNYLYFLLRLLVGIDIPVDADIGPGLYIGHYGGIVLHPRTVLGENCNLSQGVTIGEGGRGENRGVPRIGNRVYIGPGAKVFGNITVGDDVAIGANAVVTRSLPDRAVAVGIPARVINLNGSADFIKFADDAQVDDGTGSAT